MQIGILGLGDVGKSLARGFVSAGHTVRLGTRHPEEPALVAFAHELGHGTSVGTPSETAKYGSVIVLTVPGSAVPEVVRAAGPAHFSGKVVIDVTNPLSMEANAPPRLFVGHTSSAGERLQELLPDAKVVKAFNIVGNTLMVRPTLPGGPPTMFIAGNDAGAKETVAEVLGQFGWPAPVDIGGIEGSRELESLCILWVKSAFALGNFEIAFKLLAK